MAREGTSLGKPMVLVTPRSLTREPKAVRTLLETHGYRAVLAPAGQQPSAEELRSLLSECVGWIAGVEPIPADVLAAAPSLQVISRFGTGTSNVDLAAAEELGIDVCVAAGANAQSVAELALALTLDGLRSITASARLVADGQWERKFARELAGLNVLVAGFGAIGRRYAELMLRVGAQVTVYDPFMAQDQPLPTSMMRVTDFHEGLATADVVSLHCPPGEKPLIGASELQQCRPGLIIINTARAELVDDVALLAAIEAGTVAAYAVDAFHQEPPKLTPLLVHPRVIATPHVGAYTAEAVGRTLETSVSNLTKALARKGRLQPRSFAGTLAEHLAEAAPADNTRFYWLGQAGFLLRTGNGHNILIDAYLSDVLRDKYRGSLFPHERMMAPPIRPEELPRIDLVLMSHGHTDHLDPETIATIARLQSDAMFVVPNRVRDLAAERGVPQERMLVARGDDVLEPLDGIRIHAIPSAHEELDITDEGSAFLGYVIDVGDERIYHSGDCVPYPDLSQRLAALDPTLALLPVNGRDEFRLANGVPGNFTLDEALAVCTAVGIPTMIAHHWGMFSFNTVPRELLQVRRLHYDGPVSWYIPDVSAFYER